MDFDQKTEILLTLLLPCVLGGIIFICRLIKKQFDKDDSQNN